MSYDIAHIFAVRTTGATGDMTDDDHKDFRAVLRRTVDELRAELKSPNPIYERDDIDWDERDWTMGFLSLSPREVIGHKGGFMVIGGMFNYWGRETGTELARRLSISFETDVLYMGWDTVANEHWSYHFYEGRKEA